jgi:hypothetical protein
MISNNRIGAIVSSLYWMTTLGGRRCLVLVAPGGGGLTQGRSSSLPPFWWLCGDYRSSFRRQSDLMHAIRSGQEYQEDGLTDPHCMGDRVTSLHWAQRNRIV